MAHQTPGPEQNPALSLCSTSFRRGARVVEWARLESVYTVYSRIEGSNPSLSAKHKNAPPSGAFLCLPQRSVYGEPCRFSD